MAEKQNWFSKLGKRFSLKNKHIVVSVCIILLCVVVLLFPSTTKKTQSTTTTNQTTYTFDALEYANQVASNLQNSINNIKGISNAKVVVVVSQSPEIKYLTEGEGENMVVAYHKNGSNYEPIIITQFLPQISGILIVAKGTNDLAIKNNLLNAVSAVYNVDISCIDILEGK